MVKAIARSVYGRPLDVLELRDVDPPTLQPDQVLVEVRSTSVNAGDLAIVWGTPYVIRPVYGLRRPRRQVIGQDLAGAVVDVGEKVTGFRSGDEVFGGGFATFAELATAPADRLALKPADLSFDDAAALPIAGLTALQGIRDAGGVQPGSRVLINGASGGVGTYAVQVAKALGAEVTAVCSTRNVDQSRKLGADRVVDYTVGDFTELGMEWDVIFDNAASKSLAETRRVLAPRGVLIPNHGNLRSRWLGSLPRMTGAMMTMAFSSQRAGLHAQSWKSHDLAHLGDLVVSGEISPRIDRTYDLAQAPEAIVYVGEGHARGKVVIRVS